MERELFESLEPIVASQGVDLVEVGLAGAPGSTLVRVTIHAPQGVTHADCKRVSRSVAGTLDERLGGREHWSLEVSSPGLARVLGGEREFEVFRGLPVRLWLDEGQELVGRCAGTGEGHNVILELPDGSTGVIPWSRVKKAKLRTEASRGFGGRGT